MCKTLGSTPQKVRRDKFKKKEGGERTVPVPSCSWGISSLTWLHAEYQEWEEGHKIGKGERWRENNP
jgi:hypothetical protein